MTILFFEPRCQSLFGAQKSMLILARGLAMRGVNVVVTTTDRGVLADAAQNLGLRVKIVPTTVRLNKFGGGLVKAGILTKMLALLDLLKLYIWSYLWLTQTRPDVVYFNNDRALLYMAIPAYLARLKSVFYVRGCWRSRIGAFLALRFVDRIILIAEGVRSYFTPRELNRHSKMFQTLPTGFDQVRILSDDERLECRKALGLSGKKVALVVGSISPRKGQMHIVECFAEVKQTVPEAMLIIVGDVAHGEEGYLEKVRGRVKELKIQDVRFVGYDPDPSRWMQASDLTLLYSEAEGLPRSVIEALINGCPVVAKDVGGVKEILTDDLLGKCVEDKQQLISAALDILRDGRSGNFSARRARSECMAERFSMDAYVGGFERIVAELVKC